PFEQLVVVLVDAEPAPVTAPLLDEALPGRWHQVTASNDLDLRDRRHRRGVAAWHRGTQHGVRCGAGWIGSDPTESDKRGPIAHVSSSRVSDVRPPRIDGVADAITHKIDGEHEHDDQNGRGRPLPRLPAQDADRARSVQEVAPTGRWWLDAQAKV